MLKFNTDFATLFSPGWRSPLIVKLREPYVIGKPVHFLQSKQGEISKIEQDRASGKPIGKVEGYSIYVLPNGSFQENDFTTEEYADILNEMADYYFENSVLPRIQKYYLCEEPWHKKERESKLR